MSRLTHYAALKLFRFRTGVRGDNVEVTMPNSHRQQRLETTVEVASMAVIARHVIFR